MPKWATGKRSQAISDRSGMSFPYTEMVKEWNGSLVHISEFESKHPQIRRKHNVADAIALQNSRNQKFQNPQTVASNDNTLADSGGTSVGVANLTLPGDFAFENQGTSAMIPADPSLQNRRRQLSAQIGQVTISEAVANSVTLTLTGKQTSTQIGQVSISGVADPITITGSQASTQIGQVSISGVVTPVTYTVTVANPGAGNRYYIDSSLQATLSFVKGNTYTFDQSDGSNSGHPLRLSTTSNGTHSGGTEYTTGVTTNGTPGSSGAYTRILVAANAPSTLYYYCTNHSGMGGQINIT